MSRHEDSLERKYRDGIHIEEIGRYTSREVLSSCSKGRREGRRLSRKSLTLFLSLSQAVVRKLKISLKCS